MNLRHLFRKKRVYEEDVWEKAIDLELALIKRMMEDEPKKDAMTIDGQFYDATVEKYTEIMKEEPKIKREGMFENSSLPVIETVTYTNVPVIRVSKLGEFLLSLGIKING